MDKKYRESQEQEKFYKLSNKAVEEPNSEQKTKAFKSLMNESTVERSVSNAKVKFIFPTFDGKILPTTISEHGLVNTYVCSLHSAFLRYPREELKIIKSRLTRYLLRLLFMPYDFFFDFIKIDRHLSFNNWLFSTNLPPQISLDVLRESTRDHSLQYPNYILAFRSLNARTHPEFFEIFRNTEWSLIPARRVYLYDNLGQAWKKKSLVRRERKKLHGSTFLSVLPEDLKETDFKTIHSHYEQLFLEKHSHLNPQLSLEYIYKLHHYSIVEFHGLRCPESEKLVGSFGIFERNSIMTVPIIGYELKKGKNQAVYRLLISRILELAEERNHFLNLSSGAGPFKSLRGGQPEIEFTAIYFRHMGMIKRTALSAFVWLSKRITPRVLEKNQV